MKKGDSELFKGKYRIQSTMLQGWDYRRNAYYFVTICGKNRLHAFGLVDDKKMIFNELGNFAIKNSLAWPGWQEGFDERIVKNEKTLDIINQYINNNPDIWSSDKYFNGSPL